MHKQRSLSGRVEKGKCSRNRSHAFQFMRVWEAVAGPQGSRGSNSSPRPSRSSEANSPLFVPAWSTTPPGAQAPKPEASPTSLAPLNAAPCPWPASPNLVLAVSFPLLLPLLLDLSPVPVPSPIQLLPLDSGFLPTASLLLGPVGTFQAFSTWPLSSF